MTWEEFARALDGHHTSVALVGPLHSGPVDACRPTVFVDGGADHRDAKAFAGVPNICVGDGDSTTRPMDKLLPRAKDFSDLAFVLRHLPASINDVELLGFLGGRRDHELIGLGEAHQFLKRQTKFARVRFDEMIVGLTHGEMTLKLEGIFSLIAFEATRITLRGACAYPVNTPIELPPVSIFGRSREGSGEVTLHTTLPCFILKGSA